MRRIGAFEMGSACLELGLTVTWRRVHVAAVSRSNRPPAISIQQACTVDEGVYTPAFDIQVTGIDALRTLRDAIDEALKYEPAEKT